MSCRGFGSHRSHVPVRLGEGSSLDHGGRCCCVKEDVPSCESSASERRSIAAAQYCRCGALRAPSLDHLFIPEDLSIVPSYLKYSKDKFRGVRVDGRMYFMPNSQHFGRMWIGDSRRDQPRKEALNAGRDPIERANEYVVPTGPSKDIFKERPRPARNALDDWRSDRRRQQPPGRANDERRPKSRQSVNDRGSFVLTVNTGSRYQPPTSRERRFTIPRAGGTTYSSSNSRGSPRAGASSSAGSISSVGAKDGSAELANHDEKRRDRRPRIVKFADDEQFLASIDEEPEAESNKVNCNETGSKNRVRGKSSVNNITVSEGKENSKRKSTSRKGKVAHRKSSHTPNLSAGDDTGSSSKTTGDQNERQASDPVELESVVEARATDTAEAVSVCEVRAGDARNDLSRPKKMVANPVGEDKITADSNASEKYEVIGVCVLGQSPVQRMSMTPAQASTIGRVRAPVVTSRQDTTVPTPTTASLQAPVKVAVVAPVQTSAQDLLPKTTGKVTEKAATKSTTN
ncbi:hypothetical protein BIW11_09563 [Tropilaelaps mercedesae]|uniref:Uncharacterized protein n=1 Tax=Tropilaelaps mercedesae TaxID=418985 RepID=A0A1V9XJL1_9ACAR|nr:hypothetical protein BIW11_09563 [Tropilaelaps mercedesae]